MIVGGSNIDAAVCVGGGLYEFSALWSSGGCNFASNYPIEWQGCALQ